MADEKPKEKKEPSDGSQTEMTSELQLSLTYAIRARAQFLVSQASCLTWKDVLRILETDLHLDAHALDPHQPFISHRLAEVIKAPTCDRGKEKHVSAVIKKTGAVAISRCTVMEAVRQRSSYLRQHHSDLSLEGFRRVLEREMGLATHSLDKHIHSIRMEVLNVLHNYRCNERLEGKKKVWSRTQSTDDLKSSEGPCRHWSSSTTHTDYRRPSKHFAEFFEASRHESVFRRRRVDLKHDRYYQSGADHPKQEPKELGDRPFHLHELRKSNASEQCQISDNVKNNKDLGKIQKQAGQIRSDLCYDAIAGDKISDKEPVKFFEAARQENVSRRRWDPKQERYYGFGADQPKQEPKELGDRSFLLQALRKTKASEQCQTLDEVKNNKDLGKIQKHALKLRSSMSYAGDNFSDKVPVKKKCEAANRVYQKKPAGAFFRTCTLRVPPSVTKRAEQELENEGEACQTEELEQIPQIPRKEGISSNPYEKE